MATIIKSQTIGSTDSPSCTELITTHTLVNKSEKYPTFGQIRDSIRAADSYKENNIYIPVYYCEYDCTGTWSTTDLELIQRKLLWDGNDLYLVSIYIHTTHCDV